MTTTVVRDSAPGRRYRGYGALWAFLILIVVGFGVYVAYHNRAEIAAWLSTDTDVADVPPSTGGGVTIDDLTKLREDVSTDFGEALKPFDNRLVAVEKGQAALTSNMTTLTAATGKLAERVDGMGKQLNAVETEVRSWTERHDEMKARIDALESLGLVSEVVVPPSVAVQQVVIVERPTAPVERPVVVKTSVPAQTSCYISVQVRANHTVPVYVLADGRKVSGEYSVGRKGRNISVPCNVVYAKKVQICFRGTGESELITGSLLSQARRRFENAQANGVGSISLNGNGPIWWTPG